MSAKGYGRLPMVGNCVVGNMVVLKQVICPNLLLLVVCILLMFLESAIDLLKQNEMSFAPLQWLSIPMCLFLYGEFYFLRRQDRRHDFMFAYKYHHLMFVYKYLVMGLIHNSKLEMKQSIQGTWGLFRIYWRMVNVCCIYLDVVQYEIAK